MKLAFQVASTDESPWVIRLTVFSLGPQRVEWDFNGLFRGEALLDGERIVPMDIPADFLISGENILRLRLPDAHRPATGGDRRKLAVQLHTIEFLPKTTSGLKHAAPMQTASEAEE